MTWVGRAIRRLEDPALITGQGRFTADAPATHWVRFVRSPVAAGKLRNVERTGRRDGDHGCGSQGREEDHADAAQVQLQAGRPAGTRGRRRAFHRRTCGGRRRRKRGRSRGHRRSGRTCRSTKLPSGGRCARRARSGRAAGARGSGRQRHSRRQGEDAGFRRGMEQRAQDRQGRCAVAPAKRYADGDARRSRRL